MTETEGSVFDIWIVGHGLAAIRKCHNAELSDGLNDSDNLRLVS